MDASISFVFENQSRFIEELIEFCKIPSVSAKSDHRSDCRRAAQFVLDQLTGVGLEASLEETPGNPIVLGKYTRGEHAPTLLIYGHYDVQPEEPLDLWHSSPFEPVVREGDLIARGASDDKGQIFAHIKAVETLLKTKGEIPVNIVFLIEGEEETASANLGGFIAANRERLKADVAVISDSSQYGPGMPAICYGLRGICSEEIRVEGAKQDLHSGSHGGAVPSPCNILCEIIAQLKDAKGRVAIPGFYDGVLPLEKWEREAFASLPWDDEQYRKDLGLPALCGEDGYSTIERKWGRPTLDVNGLFGGYMGEGSKTIIPAWAGAKITMRLVPNQDPETISRLFREYVAQLAPDAVKITFLDTHGGGPVLVPRDARFMNEAAQALRFGFGRDPVLIREGGSIPIVSTLNEQLGINTLLLGFGLPEDNAHGPNEKFNLKDFERGILTSMKLLHLCGQ
ncbi:MAG: dipeptidase [Candidatus Hinthialibacter sp.]